MTHSYAVLCCAAHLQLAREKPLTDVDVAPGGGRAVVASADGHCCIWDLSTGQVNHVLKGHTAQ